MDFGAITTRPCENVLPPADPRCADPAFAIANPGICPPTPILIIKPGVALCCALGSIQFKAFTVFNDVETDVTALTTFTSSDSDIAVIGAGTGNATATGISAGTATIGATYQGMVANSSLTVLALANNCCADTEVGIVVLVDTSLSMTQGFSPSYATKLAFAKAAATRFITEINGAKDLVGLDTFNSDTVLTLAVPSHNPSAVAALVPTIIQTQSDTDFSGGLQQAISDLQSSGAALQVILLISDGLATVTEPNNPYTILSDFKAQGGVVMCLGVRANTVGFAALSGFATPGFFVNAYNGVDADALDFISGLKGYICAGNCTPAGDVVVNKGQLDYKNFINWDVVNGASVAQLCQAGYNDPDLFFTVTTVIPHGFSTGDNILISGSPSGGLFPFFNGRFTITVLNSLQFTCPVPNLGSAFGARGLSCRKDPTPGSVDLIGNGFFDLIPGNGLYVDLISGLGAPPPFNGEMVSKTSFLIGGGNPITLNVNLNAHPQPGPPTVTAHGTTVDALNNPIPHGLQQGQLVEISGASHSYFNNVFAVTPTSATTFDFTIPNTGFGIVLDHGQVTLFTSPKSYRLTVSLAGNQLVDRPADVVAIQVYWLNAQNQVFLLNQQVTISNFRQGFTDYVFNFQNTDPVNVFIAIQQLDIPTVDTFAGVLLGEVKFEDLTDMITLLDDNFDHENPVYIPPRCGRGTYYNPATGYAYGYNCAGYGCLATPPPMQLPDPNPLPDIESGPAGPVPTTFTSTQTVTANCGSSAANLIGCTQSGQNLNCPGVENVTLASGPDFNNLPNTFCSVEYQLTNEQTAVAYVLVQGAGESQSYSNILLQGSNDGTNWTTLDTEASASLGPNQSAIFDVINPSSYSFYKLSADIPNGTAFDFVLQLYVTGTQQASGTATATSTISQADADSKARAAALAIAQAALTCKVVFTSTQSFTAACPNDPRATYTATATVTSVISQADADAKAMAAAKAIANQTLICDPDNNNSSIFINDRTPGQAGPNPAYPYPTFYHVTGPNPISKVVVHLKDFLHSWPSDVCIVLKGPDGTTCVLMAECGNGGFPITDINIDFDDTGPAMPQVGQIFQQTYRPTNYPPFADVPAPGPPSPYGQTLSVFNGKDPNGVWLLYVCSEAQGINNGVINFGWSLTIT